MKRIALFLLALSLFAPLRAQQVQNKPFDVTLRDYTIDEIVQLFGKPTQIDSGLIDVGLAVEYPHAKFYYFGTWDDWGIEIPEGAPDRYVPDGFWTDSPDFCILSDCFPGGLRVGDRIERVRGLDIVHSKVGKGREGNGLRKMESYEDHDYYVILGEESDYFYLQVKDSVICEIDWATPDDWGWAAGGVLWRVEGKSLPAPSYILGVLPHVPADVFLRIDGLDEAWKSVKTIYCEESSRWSGTIPESMHLPDGKEDLSAYLYKKALVDGKDVHLLPPMDDSIDNRKKYEKAWIQGVYDAYLAQDMDEIGWILYRDPASPFTGGMGFDQIIEWSKELKPAVQQGPTLIIVDVSYLTEWEAMHDLVSTPYMYRIQSVKPIKKD